jgi:hypothetical protein
MKVPTLRPYCTTSWREGTIIPSASLPSTLLSDHQKMFWTMLPQQFAVDASSRWCDVPIRLFWICCTLVEAARYATSATVRPTNSEDVARSAHEPPRTRLVSKSRSAWSRASKVPARRSHGLSDRYEIAAWTNHCRLHCAGPQA